MGDFFPVTDINGTTFADVLARYGHTPRFVYSTGSSTSGQAIAAAAAGTYQGGRPLLTYANTTGGAQSWGFLSLPTALMGSGCDDITPALFLTERNLQVCSRPVSDVIDGCVAGGALDIAAYAGTVSGTRLLQRVGSASDPVAISNATIVVVVSGVPTALSRELSGSVVDLSAFTASYSSATDTCINAVVIVNRTIVWDGRDAVQLVTWVTLDNVSTQTPVAQSFSLDFNSTSYPLNDDGVTFGPAAGDERGGNPGFLIGREMVVNVSAGYVYTDTSVDLTLTYGNPSGPATVGALSMLAPSATDSSCPGGVTSVRFGLDQVSGCVLSIAANDTCAQVRASAASAMDRGINRVVGLRSYGTADSPFVDVIVVENRTQIPTPAPTTAPTSTLDLAGSLSHDRGLTAVFPDYYCEGVSCTNFSFRFVFLVVGRGVVLYCIRGFSMTNLSTYIHTYICH